jgi:diacylglycerol kinase family enzyme
LAHTLPQQFLPGLEWRFINFSELSEQLKWASGFERIVVAGGDGTWSSVLTAPDLPDRPVALLPLGTGCDLAREFGTFNGFFGAPWSEVVARVAQLSERQFSTWNLRTGDRVVPFCCYVSFGFEGAVVSDFAAWRGGARREHRESRLRSRCMYTWFGLRRCGEWLEGVTVRADEQPAQRMKRARGVLCTNIKSHMGIGIATCDSESDDNLIECVRASSPLEYLRMVASRYGVLPALKSCARGGRLVVSGLPRGTPVQADGEALAALEGDVVEITFRRAVRVLAA